MRAHFVLLLVFVAVMPVLVVKLPSVPASVPTPSVPEFALRLFDSSYDSPATVSTDIYNGQQITTLSKHIDQRTIEIEIKNTPFTPFQLKDARGNTIEAVFCYHIRWKAHFAPEKDWETLFGPYYQYLPRSSAAETVRQINITHIYDGSFDVPEWSRHMPADTQLDFQVQAMIGGPNNVWDFSGETSNWSPTQTITIP